MNDQERLEEHQKTIRKARLRVFTGGAYVPLSVLQELLFESWVDFQAGRGEEPVLVYSFAVLIVSPVEWRYRIVYHHQQLVACEWRPIGAVPLGIKKVLVTYIPSVREQIERDLGFVGGYGGSGAAGILASGT